MRKARKMSQWDLALALGVHPARISEWEHDRREPLVSTALKIAHALNCKVEDLFVL